MSEFDAKRYAEKLLTLTKNLPHKYSFNVPVDRLRALCDHVLNQESDEREPMTEAQRNVLQAVKADIACGIKPTVRSVAKRLGYKTFNSPAKHINNLIKLGYLERSGTQKQITVVSDYK